jgi:hypothetical protein
MPKIEIVNQTAIGGIRIWWGRSGSLGQAGSGVGCAVAGFFQAFVGAGGAAAAVDGDAELTPQIAQGSGAATGGFVNLTVGDGLADADVHELPPEELH